MGTASITTDSSGAGQRASFSKAPDLFQQQRRRVLYSGFDLKGHSCGRNCQQHRPPSPSWARQIQTGTAATTVSVSGSGHNYSKVFGNGTATTLTNKGSSSFTVSSTANAGLTFQVGANEDDEMTINLDKMDSQDTRCRLSKS